MGLDLLDIVLRSERTFDVKLPRAEVSSLFAGSVPGDVTAGEWFDFVWRVRQRGWHQAAHDMGDKDRPCFLCGYNLRDIRDEAACPDCGAVGPDEVRAWNAMRRVRSDAIGCHRRGVLRSSLLRRDLGANM